MKLKSEFIWLYVGILLLAGTPLFARTIPLGPELITALRCFFACLVLILTCLICKQSLAMGVAKKWVVLLGILMMIHWVTYFKGIQLAGVALGVCAFFTYPLWTTLIEPFCVKTKPKVMDFFLALVALGGLAYALPWTSSSQDALWGVLSGVFSSWIFVVRNLLIRYKLRAIPAIPLMTWQTGIAFLGLIPFYFGELGAVSGLSWLKLVALGVVFTAVAHTLFAASLRSISARVVSQNAALQPILAPLYAGVVIQEWPSERVWVGGSVVVLVVLIEAFRVPIQGNK